MVLHTKHKCSRPYGFRQDFEFLSQKSILSLCDLAMQRARTILTIIKEGHMRSIPAKLCQIQALYVRPSIMLSPAKLLGEIQPNMVFGLLT